MRKDKNQLLRLQNMIENDRIVTGDNFIDLIISDLTKLLYDYFDFRKSPNLIIEKVGDEYLVKISLSVMRIKNFANIPK